MSLDEFFHMGGYAFYVWTSYALVLIVLALNVIVPLRRKSAVMKSIARSLSRSKGHR
jgi:heme exporter protein D